MSTVISSVTGTYLGDPSGKFLDIDIEIIANNLNVEGTYSNNGVIYNLVNTTFSMPSPNGSLTTYVSIQVDNTGTLQMYTSLVSALGLQGSNLIEVYSLSIPAGATNDEAYLSNSEPVLD